MHCTRKCWNASCWPTLRFDPRTASLQALAQKDGAEEVVAVLKGIRPETLEFDTGDMRRPPRPEFSYDDPVSRDTSQPGSDRSMPVPN